MNNQVFPVWTYSYLSMLVPVFLLTDWLRYKPVVVFQGAALVITTIMLRWLSSVPAMQAMQFFYGVVTASEVAYFSYIYRSPATGSTLPPQDMFDILKVFFVLFFIAVW